MAQEPDWSQFFAWFLGYGKPDEELTIVRFHLEWGYSKGKLKGNDRNMDLKTISLYVILFLVMIGLPVLIGKLTGSNPMEFLLGDRVKGTIFGKRKKEKEEASGSMVTNPKDVSKEKNSSRQELMKTISDLLCYGRRNRFYSIIPGTLACKDEVTSLAVLMVTRNKIGRAHV